MSEKDKKQPPQAADESAAPEINNPDFQSVLKALLAAYQPILERQLSLAKNPEELEQEALRHPPTCADEFAEAEALFGKFLTDDVALRLIPEKGREQLGPVENWRWCLQHIRCCIVFGWLVCRGPRTFRAWAFYVYQYWLCVRRSLGIPVANPPTQEQLNDFRILIEALAKAYKPYLTDQLASVEFPSGIPEEVLNGKIDCFEGRADTCAIFDRLLTTEAAQALLGKAAFVTRSHEANFWFCRCWCLCSICFGCCLARARSFIEVIWCLIYYIRCLVDCFRPLTCAITNPTENECVEEQYLAGPNIIGIEIDGTATGAGCDHYTLEWRQGGGAFQSTGIHYPGNAPQGACGVVGGTLGFLATHPFVQPGPVEIQVCVFPAGGGAPQCCLRQFVLQRNLVWIRGVEFVNAPDTFDPNSQIVDGAGVVRSFGNAQRINGSAVIGGCPGKDLKRFTLSYISGFVTNPTLPGFVQFWQVDYITPLQIDAGMNKVFEHALTSDWRQPNFPAAFCSPLFGDFLQDDYWFNLSPVAHPVIPSEAPCPPPALLWTSTPLPITNCSSGRYTLRLTTEDQGGGIKHSLRQVWFDNKDIHGLIAQVAGVDPCATLNLSQFAAPGADCTNPWSAQLLGIAFDELIEEGNGTIPSDNYAMVGATVQGGYLLWIKKDGAPDPGHPVPIPGPGGAGSPLVWGPPFQGTTRVGTVGSHCANAVPPGPPPGPDVNGILALLDMRRLDAQCNPNEPDLTLKRGECCGYIVTLLVFDNSICPGLSGGRHQIEHHFPICICNDLPVPGQ